jgi:hypothetical protein
MSTGRVAQAARLCLSDAGRISVYQIDAAPAVPHNLSRSTPTPNV